MPSVYQFRRKTQCKGSQSWQTIVRFLNCLQSITAWTAYLAAHLFLASRHRLSNALILDTGSHWSISIPRLTSVKLLAPVSMAANHGERGCKDLQGIFPTFREGQISCISACANQCLYKMPTAIVKPQAQTPYNRAPMAAQQCMHYAFKGGS